MSGAGSSEVLAASELERPELREAWRSLAEARSNPFLTPEWYSAWIETHPEEEPYPIVWRVGGEVRGVLPLVRLGSGPLRILCFAGARRGDWFTPACDPADEMAMAAACGEALAARRRSWHLLQLDRVDRSSAWPEALWAGGGVVGPGRSRRDDVLPFIAFGEGGFDAYLAARSRNFRSQLGRRRRKLEREHGLSFRMTTDAATLEDDLASFHRLHDDRWERRGGSSQSEDAKAMHRSFARAALERGWLRLWIAEADGRPAAAWYGFRIGERYCYSLSGLAERYEPLALGTVLLAHTIERAAAEGAAIYDLMWGDEGYKRRFETDRREASSWLLGRRWHPARAAARSADRLRIEARRLPEGVREPAKSALRTIGRS